MKSLSGRKVWKTTTERLVLGCAQLFDSALNVTDKEDAAPVRTISKPFLRASNVWHHQRNSFDLKLGCDAAGFIFSSRIQEVEWKVSWSRSLEEHLSHSLDKPHGLEMRREDFSLSLSQPGHFGLELRLGGVHSSLIQ